MVEKPREIRVTLFKRGSVYDPTGQKRTSAMSDIRKKDRAKDEAKLRKMFGIGGSDDK